jgi:hypothetical protein
MSTPARYRELAAHDLPMTVIASDPRRVIVTRGPWPPAWADGPGH